MRTTLTIDDDLGQQIKELAHRQRKSFKQVVNEILRAGLTGATATSKKKKRFRVKAMACGFRAGIDVAKLNQVVDDLDAEQFLAVTQREL